MAYSRYQPRATNSQHWLGVVACLVIIVFGASWVILWRVQRLDFQPVHGSSMAPLLHNGDAVIIDKMQPAEPGQLVAYSNPTNPAETLVRRVVSLDDSRDTIVVKAGNTAKPSPALSQNIVIGPVHYHVAHLGYGLNFLRSPLGLATGLYLPAIIIVGLELRRLSDHYGQTSYLLPEHQATRSS